LFITRHKRCPVLKSDTGIPVYNTPAGIIHRIDIGGDGLVGSIEKIGWPENP
jgi:hypothetical protein